jgi:hypothetical protein
MENRKAVNKAVNPGVNGEAGAAGYIEAFGKVLENLPPEPSLPIPLLREFAHPPAAKNGLLWKRLERRYLRLCAVQEELGRLDFKKAGGSVSFGDFVFSQTDFSRYAKISARDFALYTEGLEDFGDPFFTENFRISRAETAQTINRSFRESDGFYLLRRPGPVILAIMRTLETSTAALPLVRPEEISGEMKALCGYLGIEADLLPGEKAGAFLAWLFGRLDKTAVTHADGAETLLFTGENGSLMGTFKPGGKAWTVTLAPGLREPA